MNLINNIIIIISLLIGIVNYLVINFNSYSFVLLLGILLLPKLIRKIKIKVNKYLELIYLIFIFISYILGYIFKLNHYIYWYDSLSHTLSGVLTSFLALEILKKFNIRNDKFSNIFIIFTGLAIASCWELLEYIVSVIVEKDIQNVLSTGIVDTMKDIMCALLGSVIFINFYIFRNKEVDYEK